MSEKKPQKVVSRNVAIALGIICIVLIGGLGGAMLYTITLLNDKNNQMVTLESQVSFRDYQISQLNSSVTNLRSQVASQNAMINLLTPNVTNLQKIANLEESTVLYDDSINWTTPSMWIAWNNLVASPGGGLNPEVPPAHIDYAGYIVVNVTSSTSNTTHVELNYTSNGLIYDKTVTIGVTGQAYFPVLPTNTLNIIIGNSDTTNINIQRATITYYY